MGRLVGDPDLLSSTKASMLVALARAVPYMIQAESAGKGYGIRDELRDALHAFNRMHAIGVAPPRGAKGSDLDRAVSSTKDHLRDRFEGDHRVNTDLRTEAIFDNLVRRGGSKQIAATFREYADQAKRNPEGQATMFGDKPSPAAVFRQAVAGAAQKEEKDKAPVPTETPDMFAASIAPALLALDRLRKGKK